MFILLLVTFIAGYLLITLEHAIHINKAAIALITAVLCWTILVLNPAIKEEALAELGHHLSSIAEIVFFLLGAMTIVELIDAHDGFQNITEKIKTTNNAKVMHCLPVRRNVELSDEILDSAHSLVTQQAANRVWAAQAVIANLLGK